MPPELLPQIARPSGSVVSVVLLADLGQDLVDQEPRVLIAERVVLEAAVAAAPWVCRQLRRRDVPGLRKMPIVTGISPCAIRLSNTTGTRNSRSRSRTGARPERPSAPRASRVVLRRDVDVQQPDRVVEDGALPDHLRPPLGHVGWRCESGPAGRCPARGHSAATDSAWLRDHGQQEREQDERRSWNTHDAESTTGSRVQLVAASGLRRELQRRARRRGHRWAIARLMRRSAERPGARDSTGWPLDRKRDARHAGHGERSSSRTRQTPPSFDRIAAFLTVPPAHSISSSKPPRARSPVTLPAGHADGKAGSRSITPAWLWTSISTMPDTTPKLPSIWKGGWRRRGWRRRRLRRR